MILWYVNPKNPNQAIELAKVTFIENKGSYIDFGVTTWTFSSGVDTAQVYEEIIRLLQEFRTRKHF